MEMIWLWQSETKVLYGYFPSNGSYNIIEWRPEGWRLTRNEARPMTGYYWKEVDEESLTKKNVFRNTMHVILEHPDEVKKKWK